MRDSMREQWTSKMAVSASPSHSKRTWSRGKSPGWAAFDLEQQKKLGLKSEFDIEPYPPIPNTISSASPFKNSVTINGPSAKSFSSIVQPSTGFPILQDDSNKYKRQIIVDDSSRKLGSKVEKENNIIPALEKLKELHSWADESLIKDILGAVDLNFNQASTLLKAMVFSGSSEETKTRNLVVHRSPLEDCMHDKKTKQVYGGILLEKTSDLAELRSSLEDCLHDKKIEETDAGAGEGAPIQTKLTESTTDVKLISGHLISAPVEPEWEEDDVYLSHRKDAIRSTRSAAQHSRAASNAYLRGDHISAQQLSLKAQMEWMAAEELNRKAAQEILSIRNAKNDVWKLDLHGLHASEAVRTLQEHLWKIETQFSSNHSGIVKLKGGTMESPLDSVNCVGMEAKTDKEQTISWQRPTVLQVITGTGNHSRGQAALPVAVRNFLIENRYRFDEARPGMVAVRPKFRQG